MFDKAFNFGPMEPLITLCCATMRSMDPKSCGVACSDTQLRTT